MDAALLFACWKPSYEAFATALNANLIPEYETIFPKLKDIPDITEEAAILQGYPLLDPRTVVVFGRLRLGTLPRSHRKRVRAITDKLLDHYATTLIRRYNRMSHHSRASSSLDNDVGILELCRLLSHPMPTLSELSISVSIITVAYPTYSLRGMNCNLFCQTLWALRLWEGYCETETSSQLPLYTNRFDREGSILAIVIILILSLSTSSTSIVQ